MSYLSTYNKIIFNTFFFVILNLQETKYQLNSLQKKDTEL